MPKTATELLEGRSMGTGWRVTLDGPVPERDRLHAECQATVDLVDQASNHADLPQWRTPALPFSADVLVHALGMALHDADVAALPFVAVVCHPLPTEGGTMHNKVVTMVARSALPTASTDILPRLTRVPAGS